MSEEPTRVLIVDDDPSLMDVLEQVLSAAGNAVITAVTGEEALKVHRLIDALIESGRSGAPVDVAQ